MNQFDKIEHAIEKYQDMLKQAYIDDIPRWVVYNKQRKVAQAACSFRGYIVTGTRHWCPIMWLQIHGIGYELLQDWVEVTAHRYEVTEGFTDQYGIFLTREEAYVIASAAGQIINELEPGVLYSESYI